ncbi:hypothetical protein LTS18_008793, partial [Coniosporium uncinatum]
MTTRALGAAYALLAAAALILLENAMRNDKDGNHAASGMLLHANGSMSRRPSVSALTLPTYATTMRDFSAATALSCGAASIVFESFHTQGITFALNHDKWQWGITPEEEFPFGIILLVLVAGVAFNLLFLGTLRAQGTLSVSLLVLSSTLIRKLFLDFSVLNFL